MLECIQRRGGPHRATARAALQGLSRYGACGTSFTWRSPRYGACGTMMATLRYGVAVTALRRMRRMLLRSP